MRWKRASLVASVTLAACAASTTPLVAPKECSAVASGVVSHSAPSATPTSVGSASASTSAAPTSSIALQPVRKFTRKDPTPAKTALRPFRLAMLEGALLLLEGPGLEVWNGVTFARRKDLEKGLHLDPEGDLSHPVLDAVGRFPDAFYLVTAKVPPQYGARLFGPSQQGWKELQKCEGSLANRLELHPWGEGVLTICTGHPGGGAFSTFGKKPWPAPVVPKRKAKGPPSERCQDPNALFEPIGGSLDTAGRLVFSVQHCDGFEHGAARWVDGAWVPTVEPVTIARAEDKDLTFEIVKGRVHARSSDGVREIVLPDAGAVAVDLWVFDHGLWVSATWEEPHAAHRALYRAKL